MQLVPVAVAFDGPPLTQEPIVVLLTDGPCEGRYETIAGDIGEHWVRIGKPGGTDLDTQMWARYDPNPMNRAERVYSGIMITTREFEAAILAAQRAGETYGESYGA